MDNQQRENSRRRFLRMAAIAVPAAVAVAVAPNAAAEAVSSDAPKSSGLRDTEHTRKYFESARF
ncbi:ubiquinol-cytochrome c reductase iron-sulfur subunit N-terminal domain-containing protein [Marinobacter sp. HL-58]|uniref:ubiquinol-cytochrome c reductase iron-sulfur subunit N-terminal domain-containing protein n=1 Tax=Marinobacter sp. HL-58 TaxID=1479237 RepID=UPI0004874B94|nr:ubiquinol-cytochrome c reductase iron-sulfur subunit N-terminal domain-containing protein [Marinobacter sp. HL-58]KPP99384.1 MAG: Ubiquitinol-cytochrome C reductase Fe-S subunit TAT signal [Marinobacter sp. HL-58]